eukprot:TRINITY_DN4456_c0_g3_i3.p3 TRINITY_DN4456_c0_g3~~TRINITY_DN4456_c0_g3_i3.p3  ORF type:complete len:102 (-),score=2.89 TRINITY_DN4456_c0_g3_i3:715-1020(-)
MSMLCQTYKPKFIATFYHKPMCCCRRYVILISAQITKYAVADVALKFGVHMMHVCTSCPLLSKSSSSTALVIVICEQKLRTMVSDLQQQHEVCTLALTETR